MQVEGDLMLPLTEDWGGAAAHLGILPGACNPLNSKDYRHPALEVHPIDLSCG